MTYSEAENSKSASSKGDLDPDPLAVAALLLSIFATASSVFQARETHRRRRHDDEESRRALRLKLLRWENDLVAVERMIFEMAEFLGRISESQDNDFGERPLLRPRTAMRLNETQLREYRILLRRLYAAGRELSTSTIELVPDVDQVVTSKFLRPAYSSLNESIQQMASFRSLDDALRTSATMMRELRKAVAFLRRGVDRGL